ncbi:hypothetical protein FRC04_006505 [Tulasnella sp. 424]|nr:hypothetical protein FRC04_006505 [Tulasnella sp. 424]KAG8981035.1 hypothetical protein FRC05_003935 [Tulasnella sp. 425]
MSRFQPYSDRDDYNIPSRQDLNPEYNPSQTANYHSSSQQYPPSSEAFVPSTNSFTSNANSYTPVTAQQYPHSYNDMNAQDRVGPLWSEKPGASSGSSKKKWLIIGGIAAVIIIAVGVGVGVAVSHKSSGSKSSSSGTSTGSSTDTKDWVMSINNVVKYNPKDLSQFETDSRLHKSMYGMAYTPIGAILPDCGATFDGVLEDVMLMSQLTTRVRLYGTDCNVTDLVLDAIQQTKTDLSVYIGIYIDNDDTVYTRQRDAVQRILKTYDVNHVLGVTVGNEFILNNMTAAGATDPTGTVGVSAAEFLVAKIQDVRSMISGLGLSKTIPVGNGDAGAYTNVQLLSAVDYFMSNIHPWFGNLAVDQAAGWTWQFFEDNNVAMAAQTTNNPELIIAEIGWPSKSSDAAHATNGPSAADIPTLQTFMDSWICQANTNQTKYFWFENMDQPWKDALYGGVEGWWGLFSSTKQLKNVTIPDCAAP